MKAKPRNNYSRLPWEIRSRILGMLHDGAEYDDIRSDAEIAAELKKYQSDYSDYETGKVELDYEKIVYLCRRFDITPNDLFGIEYLFFSSFPHAQFLAIGARLC